MYFPLAKERRQCIPRGGREQVGQPRAFGGIAGAGREEFHRPSRRQRKGEAHGQRFAQRQPFALPGLDDLVALGSQPPQDFLHRRRIVARPDPERIARLVAQPAAFDVDDKVPRLLP